MKRAARRSPGRIGRCALAALALGLVVPLFLGGPEPSATPDPSPVVLTATLTVEAPSEPLVLPVEPIALQPVDQDLTIERFEAEDAMLVGPYGGRLRLPHWLIHLHGSAPLAPGDRVRPCWMPAALASALGPHLAVLFEFGPALGLEIIGAPEGAIPVACLRSLLEPAGLRSDWRLTLHRW